MRNVVWSRLVFASTAVASLLGCGGERPALPPIAGGSVEQSLSDGALDGPGEAAEASMIGPDTVGGTLDLGPIPNACGHQLVIRTAPFALELQTTGGVVLSTLAPDGLRIGAVPSLDPDYHYDPYNFYQYLLLPARPGPKGLQWLPVERVAGSYQNGATLVVSLELSGGYPADLRITGQCPSSFTFELEAPTLAVAYVGLEFTAPADERYYGLGEWFDQVEHRGTLRPMQFELDPQNEDFYNQAHVPVPFLISTKGWGVLVDSYDYGVFDVAKTQPDRVRIEYGQSALKFHWMAASRPRDLVQTYTALTGTPAIPPVWSFAPVQWRDEVAGQTQVLQDAADIRKHDITGSGIWLDRPYETYISSMDFDPARYTDPEAMVAQMHATGFRLAGWNVPYVDPEDPAYAIFQNNDWFVKGYPRLNDFGPMADLTHPEAMDFWQERVRDAIDRGFEGWKLDYGEDVQGGVGLHAIHSGFWNGEDGDTMHHKYSDYFHRAYLEPYDGADTFIISRTGSIGGQRYTSVIWPGDLQNNFTYFNENHSAGGLPAAVIAGSSLAASGYPFFASDTGGYREGKPTSEVLLRWIQYSAFLPILQYGGCGGETESCHPWDFSETGATTYTQQTLDVFRYYSQMHTQLFPFFYRLAEKARATGEPLSNAFGLYWPTDGRHPDDQIVVGDALMVAPLVRGGTAREVNIPAATVIDFWTGQKVYGPATLVVNAPLDRVPLYLLEGAIVPMLRPGVESLAAVTDPSIDSFVTDAGRVWGYVVPAATKTSFDLPFKGGTLWTQGGTSISFGYTPGTTATKFKGTNIRVYAPSATSVARDGVAIRQANVGETATCSGCWAREPGSPWVWIGLGDMQGWTLTLK